MSQIMFLSSCFLSLSLLLWLLRPFHSAYFNIHLCYYLGFHSLLSSISLMNILWYMFILISKSFTILSWVASSVFDCYRRGCHNCYTLLFMHIFCFQWIPGRIVLSKGRYEFIFIKNCQSLALPVLTFQWIWANFSSTFGVDCDLVGGSECGMVSSDSYLYSLKDYWCWTLCHMAVGHLGILFFLGWLICCV